MRKNTIKVNGMVYGVSGCFPVEYSTRKNCKSIYGAYQTPGARKLSIWHRIENICDAFNGYDLSVDSASCFFFTCSFFFKHSGKKYRMSFTPSKWYTIQLVK